jgi:precorrin-3B C17-methyltransferase
MARVGRMAGALLLETGGEYWIVGHTKEPCDWAREGFEPPAPIDPARPYVRLRRAGPASPHAQWLILEREGEDAARELALRLLIERNASVSERLWRLVSGGDAEGGADTFESVPARWLLEVPEPIWRIVRDSVLRCL